MPPAWGDPDSLVSAVGRFVREVGFPTAVAVFVLWRLDDRVVQLVRTGEESAALLRQLRDQRCDCRGVVPGEWPSSRSTPPLVEAAASVPCVELPARAVGPWRSLSLRAERVG